MTRRLIVCADGTWNTEDQYDEGVPTATNVWKIAQWIRPMARDGTPQLVFYDRGVGTHPGLDRIVGGAFGRGIDENICDGYRFLVQNYMDGDEIYLFGFSRGAYTVRSLAGLIRNCGLLERRHVARVREAYDLYRDRTDDTHPSARRAQDFRELYGREVRIRCIGVWDTVGSLGVPVGLLGRILRKRFEFHDARLNAWVENAFHALAIDERRAPFAPSLWEVQDDVPNQRVEQVWFAGAHANVGGGYADCGLSDITFLWMKERAASCGLELEDDYIAQAVCGQCEGALRDSMTEAYRLLGEHVRPIGASPRTRESVHPTVLERHQRVKEPPHGPYAPPNLVEWLARAGTDGARTQGAG
jgi:uncharacterized protein (DUF2235 family)